MAKFTPIDLNSGFQSTQALNNNFSSLETLSDTWLSRDGTTPNQMLADFDMNSNDIINAFNIQTDNLVLNGQILLATDNPVTLPTDPQLYLDILEGTIVLQGTAVLEFATVAAIVADTTLVIGEIVRTAGYSATGDGGGNLFEVVAASTGTADGGSFIDSTGTPSIQFKGLFSEGRHNPMQWGATGDGVTDDTVALLAMFAFTPHVYFLAGSYNLPTWTGPVLSDVVIDGDGAKLVTITGAVGKEFLIVDGSLSVQNIKLDTWETGFNCYDGTPPGTDITNIWIDRIESDSVATTLLNLFDPTSVTGVESLKVTNSVFKNFERAIRYAKASNSAYIAGNTFDTSLTLTSSDIRAISLSGGDDDTIRHISIIGNSVKNITQTNASNQTFGIQAQGDLIVISGNTVRDITDTNGGATDVVGIYTKGSRVVIDGNVVDRCQDKAIQVKGEDLTRPGHPGIISNNILTNGGPTADTGQGIVFKNSNWIIVGNYLDKFNVGIKANAEAEVFVIKDNEIRVSGSGNKAIRLSHPWTDIQIIGNRLSGSNPRIDLGTAASGAIIIQHGNGGEVVTTIAENFTLSDFTDAELNSITNRVNVLGKFTRSMVFNVTQGIPIWSTGSATSSTWKDATGSTTNTPV